MKRPAVFFDRDNTLIVSDGYLGDPGKVILIPGAADAVARARKLGFAVVVISNQSGVARGMFTEEDVVAVNKRMDELLRAQNPAAIIDRHEYCPFHPEGTVDVYARESDRRKPRPGMILAAARAMALDLERSWIIGDAARDIEAGKAAHCRAILFQDPSLSASPAAKQAPRIEPDLTASRLGEALDYIETHLELPDDASTISTPTEAAAPSTPAAMTPPAAAPTTQPASTTSPGLPVNREPSVASAGDPPSSTSPATETVQAGSPTPFTSIEPETPPVQATGTPAPTTPAHSRATLTPERPANPSRPVTSSPSGPTTSPAPRPVGTPATHAVASTPAASTNTASTAARTPKVAIGSKHVPPGATPRTDPAPTSTVQPAGEARANTPGTEGRGGSPADRPRKPWREENAPQPPAAPGESRVESLLEQILLDLRRHREQGDTEFSVSKLLAGIVQVLVLAVLLFAYLRRNDFAAVQTHLLLALTLQTLTIALLIMSRQK